MRPFLEALCLDYFCPSHWLPGGSSLLELTCARGQGFMNRVSTYSPPTPRPLLHLLIGTGHREGQLGGSKEILLEQKEVPEPRHLLTIHQAPGITCCLVHCGVTQEVTPESPDGQALNERCT